MNNITENINLFNYKNSVNFVNNFNKNSFNKYEILLYK